MKRFRRQMVATGAALGIAAAVVGTAAAADQVNYLPVPSPDSQPLGITSLGGSMWFADAGAQGIGRIPPGGSPSLQGVPIGISGPAGITVGPDGNLWFTEHGIADDPGTPANEAITRVTRLAGGTFTPFPLSGPALNLQGIATGPDNNLWVAAKGTDALWRVTTLGASTNIGPVPNAQSVARGGATDPNVYVTSDSAFALGGGVYKSAGGPPALVAPIDEAFGIALGPDGNFWVTHPGGVAHVSPGGAVLGGGVGVPGSDSRGIAIGPDGAMWFAQYATDTVGVVTADGQGTYRTIPVPGCDGPEGVATGPDNAVYVTCFGSNAPLVRGRTIVRITQSGGVTPVPVVPGGGGGAVPIAGLKASFTVKKTVIAGKLFTVKVTFNKPVTKVQVRVQIRNSNTKLKGAFKKFKTIKSKLVTGTKAGIPVKIAKPGVYKLRLSYKNGPRAVNTNAVKVTVLSKRR